MHERPSVTYEDSFKTRGRQWDKGHFTLFLDGCDYVRVVTTSYSDFGEVEDFREGTLEPKSALLYQLIHFSVIQPHCSSGVRGEGWYPRSTLGGQSVGHCIQIKHIDIDTWRRLTAKEGNSSKSSLNLVSW